MASKGKRKKSVKACPNPLFVSWLTEWMEEADSNGWKSGHTYKMALSSLKKYPLPLQSGKDCKILMHFGDKICSMLDKKLEEYYASGQAGPSSTAALEDIWPPPSKVSRPNQVSVPSSSGPASSIPDGGESQKNQAVSKARTRTSSGRAYVPAYRSGPYAILVTLYNFTQVDLRGDYLTKSDLIKLAQPHCDKSLAVPEKGTFYTAFSSMSTLLKRGLVEKWSSPARYRLTLDGVSLTQSLISGGQSNTTADSSAPSHPAEYLSRDPSSSFEASQPLPSTSQVTSAGSDSLVNKQVRLVNNVKKNSLPSILESRISHPVPAITVADFPPGDTQGRPGQCSTNSATPIYTMAPGQYDVILVVDNREHFGFGRAKQQILPGLLKNGVQFDLRPITVGDFLWIAKPKNGGSMEAVLDFIVERKRLDDLSGSIVDGRYKEQKLRMKESGLRKPIYLVEYHKGQKNEKIKEDALLQAIVNTQNKTVHIFTEGTLPDLPFDSAASEMCHMAYEEFQIGGAKTKPPTVCEAWSRFLMVIPGVSLDKSQAIVEKYPTLTSLMSAYDRCASDLDRRKLLSNLTFGAAKRKIGEAVSKTICSLLYSSQPLP